MGKKIRGHQTEKWVHWVAESSNDDDGGVSVAKVRKPCPHIDKGVDLVKLHAKMNSSAVVRCEDCRGGGCDRERGKGKLKRAKKKGGAPYSKYASSCVWLCLECGHYACGGARLPITPQCHAFQHATKTRHPLVVQFENPQLWWCIQCKTLITLDKSRENGEEKDVVSEVVKLINGHSSEDSPGDAEDVWSDIGSVTIEIESVSSFLAGRGDYADNIGNTCLFKSILQDIGGDALPNDSVLGAGVHSGNHSQQDGSILLRFEGTALRGSSVGASTLAAGDTLSYDASICNAAALNSDKSKSGSIADLETRLKRFIACFDTEDRLSVTIDDIAHPLSGNQSSFEGGKVPLEFVMPLTKFAAKYGGGSFSTLFAEGKSARQKHILIKELGLVLYSMEVEEVKSEETFLVWRDACRDIINWGLNIDCMLDHLKHVARNFFGYMLRPAGSENCRTEIHRLEKAVIQLRNEISVLEQQLGKAQEDLHTRLGNGIDSDSMVCILESSWTPYSRAVHYLF